ncbi:hypothetical protein BH11PLA2_BH11PLA2_35050 [soil metagenome]
MTNDTPPLTAIDPVGWLTSFGRKPLTRNLEPVRDVIALKALRKAHGDAAEQAQLEAGIRERLGPVIKTIFDNVGLVPQNLPEEVARDAVVQELLDKLCASGFLRMADLRDALARFQLKLPDTTLLDFISGDALLRADRQLGDALYGVYHRGEIYLRAIQRFSGLAFGTRLGRAITQYMALPFGGAYLTVEFVKHMSHAAAKLAASAGRMISGETPPPKVPHPHEAGISPETLTAVVVLGFFYLLLLHVTPFRRGVIAIARQIGTLLRFVFGTVPSYVISSPPVQLLLNNRFTRWFGYHLAWPIVMTLPWVAAQYFWGYDTNISIGTTVGFFLLNFGLCNTPLGTQLRREFADWLKDAWRFLRVDVLAGILSWIFWFFRGVLGFIEICLHTVDEWLRVRGGDSIVLKALLAFVWFPIAYVIRFVFYLLLEPQVNPLKHFPVVTVSHKIMIGLVGTVAETFHISIEEAGLCLSLVPGIFGFLAWEFLANWRLYSANRPATLRPLPIGHHGETIRGLLRPGFHSGTIPKLLKKIAKAESNPKRLAKLHREEHHIEVAIQRFVERQLLEYWRRMPAMQHRNIRVDSVRITEIEIVVAVASEHDSLTMSWRYDGDTITGNTLAGDWAVRMSLLSSIDGLMAQGSVPITVTWNDWLVLWAVTNPMGSATPL